MSNKRTAAAAFATREAADAVINELRLAGFSDDTIGVMDRGDAYTDVTETEAAEGGAIGAISGAALGALGGLAVATGIMAPIGPVIAGGALAGILASSAVGAAAGGMVGALIGMGFPEEEARFYEGELAQGRTLVTVQADDRYDEAVAILRRGAVFDPIRRRPLEAPMQLL